MAHSATRRFSINGLDTTILTVDPRRNVASHEIRPFLISSGTTDTICGRPLANTVEWSIIKRWLHFCMRNHSKHCKRSGPSHIPGFRVIDCETRRIVAAEISDSEYITLSYVWGQTSEDQFDGQSLPKELLRTIEDAIQAVRSIG